MKQAMAVWTLPLVAAAFLFVHLSDRKLPKWCGMLGCALGLYGAHISYGVLQEYVMTQPYGGPSEAYGTMPFPSVSFLVCANRVMATLFAFIVVKYVEKKPLGLFGGVDAEGSVRIACLLPSLTNVAATWFQYASLWYVTFPTQMIFKSLKLVPVLICGQVFMKRSAPLREWADAILITAGVLAFTWFAEQDPSAGEFSWKHSGVGMLMLLGFLLCDAVTPSLQKRAFSNSNLDAFQMMFWIGAASSVYAGAMLYFSGELNYAISFLMTRQEALFDVLALSLIATLGQIFIYVTVQKHGPVTLSMIMTTRQIGSIILSAIFFGHQLPQVAIGAAAVVFSVLLVRSYRSGLKADETKKGKALMSDAPQAASSDATSEYPTGQSAATGSSQMSSAFGLAKGFASKYSSKAAALTGKLRG
jgi:adenosine 3'-phospho 5'-phosphosulfate transporter B2